MRMDSGKLLYVGMEMVAQIDRNDFYSESILTIAVIELKCSGSATYKSTLFRGGPRKSFDPGG